MSNEGANASGSNTINPPEPSAAIRGRKKSEAVRKKKPPPKITIDPNDPSTRIWHPSEILQQRLAAINDQPASPPFVPEQESTNGIDINNGEKSTATTTAAGPTTTATNPVVLAGDSSSSGTGDRTSNSAAQHQSQPEPTRTTLENNNNNNSMNNDDAVPPNILVIDSGDETMSNPQQQQDESSAAGHRAPEHFLHAPPPMAVEIRSDDDEANMHQQQPTDSGGGLRDGLLTPRTRREVQFAMSNFSFGETSTELQRSAVDASGENSPRHGLPPRHDSDIEAGGEKKKRKMKKRSKQKKKHEAIVVPAMSRRNTNTLTESGSGQFPADTGIGPQDSVSRRYSTFVVSPPSSDAEELEEGEEYEEEEEEEDEEEEIHQEQEMQENIFHTISGPRGEEKEDDGNDATARVKLPSNDDAEFVLTPVLPRSQDQSIDPDTPETFTVESPAAVSTDRQALDKVKEETTSPAEQQAQQKEVEQQHRSTLAGQGLLSNNKVPHQQQQQQQQQKTAASTTGGQEQEETNDTPPQPYRAKVTLLTDAADREADEDDDEPTSFSMGGGTSMATLSIDAKVTELLMVLFSKSRQSPQSARPTAVDSNNKTKKKKAKKEKKQPTNDSPCMKTMYDSCSAEEECDKKINDDDNTDSSSVFDDDDDTSSINSIGDAERHEDKNNNTAEHKRFLLQASGLTHAELMDLAPLTSWLMPGAHDDSADLLAILRSIAASTQEDIEGGNDYYGNPAIDEAAGSLLTKEDSLELSRKTVAAQKAHLDKMEEESASESNAKITAEAKEELRSMLRREHASRRAENGGDQAKMNDDELSPSRRYDENEKVMDALFAVRVAFHRVEVAKSLRRPQLSKVGGNKTGIDDDDDEMARHIKESKARQKRLEELVTTQFNRAVEQAMRVILEARRQNLALTAASAQ